MSTTNPQKPRPPRKTDAGGNHLYYDSVDGWGSGKQVWKFTGDDNECFCDHNDDSITQSFTPVGESSVSIVDGIIQ